MGEDIEEAQELPVDPARGGHGAWEEGIGSAIPVGVPVPVWEGNMISSRAVSDSKC